MSPGMERKASVLINPFAGYAAGFLLALGVYSLGYSDLYPPLQPSLNWFVLSTCVVCLCLARSASKRVQIVAYDPEPVRRHIAIFAAIMGLFVVEVIVNGGIPLLLITAGADVSYLDFGIPVLHVAFFGFCYFFAVYWFDLYLLRRGLLFLAFSGCALCTSILMFSRGAFVITLIALIGVYIQRRGLRLRLLVIFAVLSAAALWGFGRLGDIRTHGVTGESVILTIGDASDKFLNSNVPTELFWPYLYASSPLANLQLNISNRVPTNSPSLYFALEFFPDFISKRLVSEETRNASIPFLITEELTVSTMYGWSFALLGWPGIWLSFSYFVVVSLICLKVLRRSRYLVSATSILTSLAFLGIFDNMYVFSGGILQVYIALLLKGFERIPNISGRI